MVSSNERIDHAAEARHWLSLNGYGESNGYMTDANGHLFAISDREVPVAVAQVHATLALVEQQRIVAKLTVALVEQVGALAQTQVQPGYPSDPMLAVFEYLTDDERKGLGL